MRISMPRGDIRLVRFTVNNPDKTLTDIEFTEIYFTVKRNYNETRYLFQKRLSTGGIIKLDQGDYQIKIEPQDTQNMTYGKYKFDIELKCTTELKETFVGDFELTEEVTFPENEE